MGIIPSTASICLLLLGCAAAPPAEQAAPPPDLRPYTDLGGDFALIDQRGKAFALESLRGRMALLFFGYTYCPDFCPSTLSRLMRVHELVGDSLATVFVSVDVERDTPEVLSDYLGYFPLETVGLTGSREQVDAVVEQYGAEYQIEARDGDGRYLVNHSTDVYLLDDAGRVRYMFGYDYGPEEMAAVIAGLQRGQGEDEMRSMADDALLVARDLGTYGCGTWRQGAPQDYNFWNIEKRPARAGPEAEQPAYEYDLGSRTP